jgi:START domain
MNRPKLLWLFVFLNLGSALTAQNHAPWKFRHDRNGVQVYTRKDSTTGILELKLRTEAQAKLSQLVALTNDVPNLKTWAYRLKDAYIVRKVSDNEGYLYMLSDFPSPFSDRDVILHFVIKQDPNTKQVVSSSQSAYNFIPENKGIVRVKIIETKWTFTPLGDGKVRLEYQIKSDPAGSIPKWLVNLAADEAPVRSMLALKKLLANYHNAHVGYIKD